MRKILSIISAINEDLAIPSTIAIMAIDAAVNAIDRYQLKDDEILELEIYQDDFHVKKILKPKVLPRYGLEVIRNLDKPIGLRLYVNADCWWFKLLKYF